MTVADPTAVLHRMCPSCDAEPPLDGDSRTCPSCGARLVELRGQADDVIGKVIDGRFEVRERIGEGGMGTVYRAWQRSIGREVAIKLIDQRHVRDAMVVRRFLREARLASQLSQPNTISVFDFGQSDDGRLFIAMELVRGRTVAEVVKTEGRFPLPRALRIAIQLCDALEAAHRLSIIHRDLKPTNVLILDDPPGRDLVKVLDFGLAKSMTDEESESTLTGFVVGTPRFMAPEVALGGDPAPTSDLYALGVLLAEITIGARLWEAANFSQLLALKSRGLPIVPTLPPVLLPLLNRLLSPDPSKRPASAAELRAELLELAGGDESTPIGEARPAGAARSTAPTIEVPEPSPEPSPPSVAVSVATGSAVAARKPPVIAIAAALIVGVAVLGLAMVAATRERAPAGTPDAPLAAPRVLAADPPADAATAAPADAAVIDQVVIHVESTPAGAAIAVGDRAAGTTPRDVELPRGSAPVIITVTSGGKAQTRRITPDRDQQLNMRFGSRGKPGKTVVSGDDLPF